MRSCMRVGVSLVLVLMPGLTTAQTTGQTSAARAPLPVQREVTGQLGGSINNAGLQQTLGVSWTRPLVSSTHPLIKGAHVSTGVTGALTPALGRIGVWLEFAPLSILEFRTGVDRSSYFGTFNSLQSFDSYAEPFDNDARDARGGARAGTATRLYFAPTIKLQFGPVVIASTTELEGWRSDASGPYFYEPTRDTLLASERDGLLTVSSVIMYRRPLASGSISVGAIHQTMEAPRLENNIEKYGLIGVREFGGRRFHLPNARLTGVISRYAAGARRRLQPPMIIPGASLIHSSHAARRRLVAAALLVLPAWGGSVTATTIASTESRALTKNAFSRAYELRFAESLAILGDARRADPSDPAPLRAAASVTWMEILFSQGVATFAAFQGDASGDAVSRPAVPPHLAQRFLAAADDAVRLAQRRAAAAPDDPDAQYQLAASIGLVALYRGTVDGRAFSAFTEGRRAVRLMERLRQKNPDHRESALIPGIYRYVVSTLSWPKRMIAAAAGLPGDREDGIRLLETAAAEPAETATDAALVLMIVFNREGRYAQAAEHLQRLIARHPENRLLQLNLAATALEAGRHSEADTGVTAALARNPDFSLPAIPGERALWRYVRGAARAALLDPGARDDLSAAVRDGPRDWVRARAHLELARVALHHGWTQQARVELDAAEHFGRRAGDDVAIERARKLRRVKGKVKPGMPGGSSANVSPDGCHRQQRRGHHSCDCAEVGGGSAGIDHAAPHVAG